MIDRIIHFSIHNKLIIGLFVLAMVGWGTYSLTRLPIDAIPDITNNQVQIIALAPSLAVQEVESFITAPLEVSVASIPDIIELRSISRLGLSVVTVVFNDGTDIYWARQQLSERLREAEESIPAGLAKIELAPISSGLGEIYQYRLAVKKGYESKYSLMELRTLQDWVVRREMLGTPGVADINSYGGFVKQFEIAVNPERLRGMGLTLTDIFTALEKNNENTGSAYIDKKPTAYFIRGIGLVKTLEDVEKIAVKTSASGMPVLIRDVAEVRFGNATRYGAFVVDTTEAVGGVVMMLKGANAHEVIDQVTTRIKSVQKSLPEGVIIEPYLNRSELVGRAIGTVSRNLIEGALIVIFILVLMLGNARAGLIVASVIPLSMLFAVSLMNLFGVSGNLMSLGAIDFGLIVDGAVIIVESVVHRLTQSKHHHQGIERLSQKQMDENVFESARRMMSSATFGQVIILIVYIPIMALVGIEGKMFRPMAQVVTFALAGAAILSLTWVPMASALFLNKRTAHRRTFSDRMMEATQRAFDPVIAFALRRKLLVSALALILFVLSLMQFSRLGGEFIPQLEEGDLAAGVITLQGGSLSNTVDKVIQANKILLDNFPEIKHTVCKIGAGEIPTDPTPMETGDYIITLKDKREWTSAKTREELVAKMEEKLVVLAGVKFEFQQPIQMRFNELLSGSRQDVAVKVYGDDLNILSEKAAQIERIIQGTEGVEDLNVEKVTGLAQVQVDFNRERLAQYGISVEEANQVLKAAFAGSQAGVVYDNEKRFGLVVRLDKDYRQRLEDVKNLSVALPDGSQIAFEQIADVSIRSGPAQVSREDTRRRITVGFNVRNRDIESVISEVSGRIDKQVSMPSGYYIAYGGQFQNLNAARERLAIAVPVALLLIFLLLYFTFKSMKQTLLIFTAVPLAAIGGVFALWIRDMNFSISAGVGFIALFGVAVLNGIVLIAEFNRLEKEGISDITQRVLKGLHTRLRPVMMTAAVASMGFLPMALSTSAGAEVQKPLATVVIGGLISATFLTLVILPVFYVLFSSGNFRSFFRRKAGAAVLILILTGLGASTELAAQPYRKISLDTAIQSALDSNRDLRSAAYRLEESQKMSGASWDIPKTSVQFQYGRFNSYTYDNSITVSQSLAFPGVYTNQSKLAKSSIRGSEIDLEKARLNICSSVKQTYWHLAYLVEMKELLSYQDSLYSAILRASELRMRSGEGLQLETIAARTQSLDIRNQLQQVESDILIQSRKLGILMNSPAACLPLDTLYKIPVPPILSDSIALERNPDYRLSRLQTEQARIQKKIEQNLALPEISVGYFSQTMIGTMDVNSVPREFGPGDRIGGVQAGITVPVWYKPWSARVKAAGIRTDIARTEEENQKLSILSDYGSLTEEYLKYSRSVDYYATQALPEAAQITRQAEQSFRAGALDYLEYVHSLAGAIDLQRGYLDTLEKYIQSIINLEYLTGKIR
jgi:heavy metal efflux system protein